MYWRGYFNRKGLEKGQFVSFKKREYRLVQGFEKAFDIAYKGRFKIGTRKYDRIKSRIKGRQDDREYIRGYVEASSLSKVGNKLKLTLRFKSKAQAYKIMGLLPLYREFDVKDIAEKGIFVLKDQYEIDRILQYIYADNTNGLYFGLMEYNMDLWNQTNGRDIEKFLKYPFNPKSVPIL